MILSSNQTTICYYLLNMSGERLIPPPGRNGEQLASAPHKPGFFAESGIGTDLVIKPAIVFLKQLPPPEMARALGISQTGTPEKKQPLGVQVDQLQSPQGETRGVTGMQSPIGSVEQQFQRIQSRDQARSKPLCSSVTSVVNAFKPGRIARLRRLPCL